jgi:hypothetical protein
MKELMYFSGGVVGLSDERNEAQVQSETNTDVAVDSPTQGY